MDTSATPTGRSMPAGESESHGRESHGPESHGPELHGPELHGPESHGPELHGPGNGRRCCRASGVPGLAPGDLPGHCGRVDRRLWAVAEYAASRGPLTKRDLKTEAVQRGELAVIVSADGNVESAVNTDLKCEVAGGSAILWIVEDGELVKQGDKLVELDSSALDEKVNTQKIALEKARALMIQAEKNFAAAQIAVQEYVEGTFVTELLNVESQITIAAENLRSAQNTLDHSERMFRKGYISALDLASQTFSVQRAQQELDSANTAKNVLVKYTKVKMLQELESKRDSAEAQVNSERASFALEESRLKRLEAQVLKCVITAPADGMAVYANQTDHHGRSDQPLIELGAAIRERQTILRLPDLARMQVKILVHESSVEALGRALLAGGEGWQSLASAHRDSGQATPGPAREYRESAGAAGLPLEFRQAVSGHHRD